MIGSSISQAEVLAAGPTAGIAVAAADEISEAVAALFRTFAQEYQDVSQQVAVFQQGFAQALTAASNSYAQAEAMAAETLAGLGQPIRAFFAPLAGGAAGLAGNLLAAPAPVNVNAALILSPSGVATPSATYVSSVYSKFVLPHFPSATPPQAVSTPEGLYPFTGVKDLTLNISVARGALILRDAILQQVAGLPVGGSIAVMGYSQSSVLSSLVMPMLASAGVPSSQVNFVLLGNPMNPNGGALARFAGLEFPALGFTFYGATPDNLYPTVTYTLEYDGFADFPRYPLNLLADVNAVMGIALVHGNYPLLTQAQIGTAIQLPTQGPTQSTYYMIPTEHLPLLQPLRLLPYVGNPLAELLEPNMRVLVNLGYGDPAYGYDTGPANVPTSFGLFPPVSPLTVLDHLAIGTEKGFANFGHELQAQGPPRLPDISLPGLVGSLRSDAPISTVGSSPASIVENVILAAQRANDLVFDSVVEDLSTAYGALLPTADIVSSGALSLPGYDVDLFLDGMLQIVRGQLVEGLLNAFVGPIAANVGLSALAGGFQLIVLTYALDTIIFGTPHPYPFAPAGF